MTARFIKRMFNDEDGTRTLAFYEQRAGLLKALNPFASAKLFIRFNLNELEDLRMEMGDLAFAVMMTRAIEGATGFTLTPAEIEYALEDI